MEWENKTEMTKLGNVHTKNEENRKKFQDFVLEHIDTFDNQAWDMFSQLTFINPDEMVTDVDFWAQVYARIKDVDCNVATFGFSSGMRIALIQTICEDVLLLNK